MPIIINKHQQVDKKSPPVENEYVWDRELRKLIKRDTGEEVVTTKNEQVWDAQIKQTVSKPEPAKNVELKRQVPSKKEKQMPDHYIKVEDGSLQKFYNTKSQYLKDMAALDNL